MNTRKQLTVADWDARESEIRTRLNELASSTEILRSQRGDELLLLVDGDQPAARKRIDEIEQQLHEKEIEIEALNASLSALPRKRNYAKAQDVEDEALEIQNLNQQLADQALRIDQSAEAFVLAVKSYYDVLGQLAGISRQFRAFKAIDIGALNSLGVFLRKHDLWKFIKVGYFRDAETMTQAFEKSFAVRVTSFLVSRMKDHAQRLRDENESENTGMSYCQKCYGNLIYPDYRSEKKICKDCGAPADE